MVLEFEIWRLKVITHFLLSRIGAKVYAKILFVASNSLHNFRGQKSLIQNWVLDWYIT